MPPLSTMSSKLRLRWAHGRVALLGLLVCSLLAFLLPWLAELTPPGVNMTLVAEEVELKKNGKCPGACDKLVCPVGWTTSLSSDGSCKCICTRLDPNKLTEWDLKNKAKLDKILLARQKSNAGQANHPDIISHGVHKVSNESDGSPPVEQLNASTQVEHHSAIEQHTT
ncbi:MAG: hypothetical protein SGPRY_003837 [Prymnesium sp.]